jgi:hypothetical protein
MGMQSAGDYMLPSAVLEVHLCNEEENMETVYVNEDTACWKPITECSEAMQRLDTFFFTDINIMFQHISIISITQNVMYPTYFGPNLVFLDISNHTF